MRMNGVMQKRMGLVGLMVSVLLGVGCTAPMAKTNLTVTLDQAAIARGGETEVDVIAMSDPAALNGMDMTDYFLPGTSFRESLKTSGQVWSTVLTPGMPSATLSKGDAIWNDQWKNAKHLFIMANILGARAQGPMYDPRRIVRNREWLWDDEVTATVGTASIQLNPEPKERE